MNRHVSGTEQSPEMDTQCSHLISDKGTKQFNGEKRLFSRNGARITTSIYNKNKKKEKEKKEERRRKTQLDIYRTPYQKTNSKWIIGLNGKPEK